MNRVGICVIPNNRIFASNYFNFKFIFALIIFEDDVASKVFSFVFCCAVPRRAPVGDIRFTADGVEDVAVACTVSLWDYGSGGSLWVHPSEVIHFPPGSSASNISTTVQTPDGGSSADHCVPVRLLGWSGR